MKFSLIAATLVAAAAAQYSEEVCSGAVTVTVTETVPYGVHTPSAPASLAVTAPAPYPTGNTAAPIVPTGALTPLPSEVGTVKPSGTGAYSAPPTEFTGAAAQVKVGGFVAGVGAVAAFFL